MSRFGVPSSAHFVVYDWLAGLGDGLRRKAISGCIP